MARKLDWWKGTKDARQRNLQEKGWDKQVVCYRASILKPLLSLIYGNDVSEGLDSYLNAFVDDAEVTREAKRVVWVATYNRTWTLFHACLILG